MTTINFAASLQVQNALTLSVNSQLTVDAYDKIEVAIEPGATNKAVAIQPGAANKIRLLVVKSSVYSDQLSYFASDGGAAAAEERSKTVTLDGPQIFIGAGGIGLFATDPPKLLKFSNSGADQALIEILVGRDATL